MTEDTATETIPVFTEGDRLRKARELTGLDQEQFADELGVSRGTISNYERSAMKNRRPIVMRAWAQHTGVSLAWLETGEDPHPSPPGQAVGPANDLEALTARKEAEARRRRGFADDDGDSDTHRYADPLQPTG